MTSKVRIDAQTRVYLENVQDQDFFTLPKGCYITDIKVEKKNTVAGTVYLGTSKANVSAVAEIIKLALAEGGVVAAGNVTFSLRGATPVQTAVSVGETQGLAAAAVAIAAGTYTGWTQVAAGAKVTFTAGATGVKTGSNTLAVAATGAVGAITVKTPGSAGVAEVLELTLTVAPITSGNLSIVIRGATAVVRPVVGILNSACTEIAASSYPGWTAAVAGTGSAPFITFTASAAGDKDGINAFVAGTSNLTGTITTTTVGKDLDTTGVSKDVVLETDLSLVNNNVSSLTVAKPFFSMTSDTKISVGKYSDDVLTIPPKFNLYVFTQLLSAL